MHTAVQTGERVECGGGRGVTSATRSVGLAEQVERWTEEDLDRQRVGWLPRAWVEQWNERALPRLDVVESLVSEYEKFGTIRRSFVAGQADPVALFISAMAWGFGDDARGLYRVTRMLEVERDGGDPLAVVHDVVAATRSDGAAAGFRSLFRDGRSRVMGLGIAFGTKLLHFAGTGYSLDPVPLILDLNVWKGSRLLGPGIPVPDPRRYCTSAAYEGYCSWAQHAVAGTSGALVEFTLFQGGRGLWT